MRSRLWLVVGFALVISPFGYAQQTDPDFTKARQARIQALHTGDQAAFEHYTADAFIVTGPTGRVEDKAQRVSRANRAQPQNPSAFEDEKITPYGEDGEDTVILTWRMTNPRGGMRVLEVWVKERGIWKVAAVQMTPIQNSQ